MAGFIPGHLFSFRTFAGLARDGPPVGRVPGAGRRDPPRECKAQYCAKLPAARLKCDNRNDNLQRPYFCYNAKISLSGSWLFSPASRCQRVRRTDSVGCAKVPIPPDATSIHVAAELHEIKRPFIWK